MRCPLISDVDKVANMTLAFVTLKHHSRLLEISFKLRAWFVESIATIQQLYHIDAEVLFVVRPAARVAI